MRVLPAAVCSGRGEGRVCERGVVLVESGGHWRTCALLGLEAGACLDPDADVEMLEGLEREIRERLVRAETAGVLLKRMEDTFSNTIRLTASKAVLADSPQEELGGWRDVPGADEKRRAHGERKDAGLPDDAGEFERQGVWH